jgi:transcriptional regulator with XRE-family HTH domain
MIGKRLKQLREEHDLLQKELAEKLNISQQTISLYESDKREPDYDMLKKIAEFFNVSTDFLLGESNIRNPYNSDDYKLTPEEKELLEKIKADPDLSILFHDLKDAPKRKIKQLLKTWDFINEQFDEMEKDLNDE